MTTTLVRSLVRLGVAVVLGFGLVALQPAPARASSLALDFNAANGTTFCNPQPNPGCSVGWAFEVNSEIRVDSLGYFDFSSNGLVDAHEVGIFDASGTLLASATVSNASTPVASAAAFGRWLFQDISPLVLQPGHYTIGAFALNQSQDVFIYGAVVSTIPQISYLGGRANFNEVSLHDPLSGPFDGFEPSVFGPSFIAQPVPEPATLVLVAAGALALLRRGRS